MKKTISNLQSSVSNEQELLARVSQGEYVWKVEKFSELFQKMRRESTMILYSNPFYTSVYGYKVKKNCYNYHEGLLM
jgi:hypothetical protein